jgi:DNA replication protein
MKKPFELALDALEHGHVNFPYILLTQYRSMGLSDQDMMVILHVISYQQIERTFPSLDELVTRMTLSKDEIAGTLQRLLSQGIIQHKDHRVSVRPLLKQSCGVKEQGQVAVSIHNVFEDEFGRLLSPLEYEQILSWLEEDQYPQWLVIEALKETVMAGVYNLRYVDTILRGCARSNISSEKQLAEHRKRFRTRQEERPNSRKGARTDSASSRSSKSSDGQGSKERVVPAAQPGKYNRFYELYNSRHEVASGEDKTTTPTKF